MTNVTTKQLNAYLARYFPGLHGQVNYHGVGRRSIDVFDASGEIVLATTITLATTLADIGRSLRT